MIYMILCGITWYHVASYIVVLYSNIRWYYIILGHIAWYYVLLIYYVVLYIVLYYTLCGIDIIILCGITSIYYVVSV